MEGRYQQTDRGMRQNIIDNDVSYNYKYRSSGNAKVRRKIVPNVLENVIQISVKYDRQIILEPFGNVGS
jgi:hypothetical protein